MPRLWLLILIAAAVAGCRQAVNVEAPPQIVYGEDVCDHCAMIINEERFASAYWTVDGEARRFDDIGGMLAHYQETQEAVTTFWVHDYTGGDWLNAENAFFVMDPEMTTPMGFGFAACATETEAKALAYGQDGAVIMNFDTLMTDLEAGRLDLDPFNNHSHNLDDHDMEDSAGDMSGNMDPNEMDHDTEHDG
ncbi:MAG: nitrous oxide reductase accessory protein NosL [Anaerolineae bacterium]